MNGRKRSKCSYERLCYNSKMKRIYLLIINVFIILFFFSGVPFAQETLEGMRDETLSYFKPLRGKVTSREANLITADLDGKSGIKKGMRLNIFREGLPFVHPVTKEQIGNIETPVGKAEVIEIKSDGSILRIINGDPKEGDILRISETKVRVLFYQDRSVPWEVGEALYQRLKESGRFDLVDSSLYSSDDTGILEEAKKKGTTAIIALSSHPEDIRTTLLKERIIWAEDGVTLTEIKAGIDASLIKETQFRDLLSSGLSSKDALLFFDLPYSGRLIITGNFDGEDNSELAISDGKVLRIYTTGISLFERYKIDVPVAGEHLWLDRIDLDFDGRDEIILTILSDDVLSFIYYYDNGEGGFRLLWKEKAFLRVIDGMLLAQAFAKEDGFSGPVYVIDFKNRKFSRGRELNLPQGINIYDFSFINLDGKRSVLAYDDKGYLSLYDADGLRLWISKEDSGGFINTFKRAAPTIMVERGEWSVKDRLFTFGNKAVFVKRVPLADIARTLGFKRSELRMLWWTGLSMEETLVVDNISGSVVDYAMSGDKIYVISKPLFGIKAKNILKGENPLGSMLYVYSLKGL